MECEENEFIKNTSYCNYRKYGLSKDSYIRFLGRLVPEKGVQYLIKAFRQAQTEKNW